MFILISYRITALCKWRNLTIHQSSARKALMNFFPNNGHLLTLSNQIRQYCCWNIGKELLTNHQNTKEMTLMMEVS